MPLSHSQLKRYQDCPKSYYYHYIKRLRPSTTTGALLFGDALDKALNSLLLNEGDAYSRFMEAFTYGEINKVKEYLPTSQNLVYATTDYDVDLLSDDDFAEINKVVTGPSYDELKEIRDDRGYDGFSKEQRAKYNYINWLCLTKKAKYIIDGYRAKILPKIKRVIAVQEKIEISNGDDQLLGFVDLIAELEDHGVVIIDHKSSKMDYEDDAVSHSAQLILYTHCLSEKYNTNKAGFIVMKKGMKKDKKCSVCGHVGKGTHKTCDAEVDGKRCNGKWDKKLRAEFQVIVDEVPEAKQDMIMENIDELNKCIKAELYPANYEKCTNWYGGMCAFYHKCHSNSMKGLVEMPEPVEKKTDE